MGTLERPRIGRRIPHCRRFPVMSDLVKALVFAVLFLAPCLVATRCASERRLFRGRNRNAYEGPERRDLR